MTDLTLSVLPRDEGAEPIHTTRSNRHCGGRAVEVQCALFEGSGQLLRVSS